MTRKARKTGRPAALDDEEDEITERTDTIAPGPQSIESVVTELFGTTTYQHEKGKLPPIEWLRSKFATKSAIIRFLYEEGHEPKVIAKTYGLKYQHVRNVLTNELKRGPNEPFRLDDHYNIKLTAPNYAPRLQPRKKEESTPTLVAPGNELDPQSMPYDEDSDNNDSDS
jgi:hypothetical protein